MEQSPFLENDSPSSTEKSRCIVQNKLIIAFYTRIPVQYDAS